MNKKRFGLLLQKLAGTITPIMWGGFVWFMGWGVGSAIIPYYSLNYIIQGVVAVLAINYFFGLALQQAYKNHELTFFQNYFWVPSWIYFVGLAIIAACFSATPFAHYEFISSLIRGLVVSAVLEELIARSFFVKYRMGVKEFIIFNILSSLAFTLMHSFYVQEGVAFYDLLQCGGHFWL